MTVKELESLKDKINTLFDYYKMPLAFVKANAYGMYNYDLIRTNEKTGAVYARTQYGTKKETYATLKQYYDWLNEKPEMYNRFLSL